MLLYMTSKENQGIFDFLTEEQGIIIKKLEGTFSLKQFVIHDLRSLNHFQFFAIDLLALKDSEEDILEAVDAFGKMFHSRVIFYVDDLEKYKQLGILLTQKGITNLLTAVSVDNLKDEIRQSVSDLGISIIEAQEKLGIQEYCYNSQKEKVTFLKKNIKVIVTGASHKAGTTTIAIQMVNYLASIGAEVCYVEANHHGHLKYISEAYLQMIKTENGTYHDGVQYVTMDTTMQEEAYDRYDFIVYDMGILSERVAKVMKNNRDINILCATTKPYEVKCYEEAVRTIEGTTCQPIFSFASDREKRMLMNKYENVSFMDYAPELLDGVTNKQIWEAIIEKYKNGGTTND